MLNPEVSEYAFSFPSVASTYQSKFPLVNVLEPTFLVVSVISENTVSMPVFLSFILNLYLTVSAVSLSLDFVHAKSIESLREANSALSVGLTNSNPSGVKFRSRTSFGSYQTESTGQ